MGPEHSRLALLVCGTNKLSVVLLLQFLSTKSRHLFKLAYYSKVLEPFCFYYFLIVYIYIYIYIYIYVDEKKKVVGLP